MKRSSNNTTLGGTRTGLNYNTFIKRDLECYNAHNLVEHDISRKDIVTGTVFTVYFTIYTMGVYVHVKSLRLSSSIQVIITILQDPNHWCSLVSHSNCAKNSLLLKRAKGKGGKRCAKL